MASGVLGQALEVVVIVAAALLLPAGIAKLRRPSIAREALGLDRFGRDGLVRLVGVGELVLATWVLLDGSRLAVGSLALTYAVFVVIAARQRQRGASCGCFGATAAPTAAIHIALNAVAALAAATAAVAGSSSAVHLLLRAGSVERLTLVVATAVAVASAQLVLTSLPDLASARRQTTGRP